MEFTTYLFQNGMKNLKLNHTLPIIPIFRESKKCCFQITFLVGIFFMYVSNIFIVVKPKDKLEDADIPLDFYHCPSQSAMIFIGKV